MKTIDYLAVGAVFVVFSIISIATVRPDLLTPITPACDATLRETTLMNAGQVGDAWVFAPQPAGAAIVVYPATALWHDGDLWARARVVDGEHDGWMVVWDDAWRVALVEPECWE